MFLALNYEAGNELYLSASRAAPNTARALAGVIGDAGIPIDYGKTEVHLEPLSANRQASEPKAVCREFPKRKAAENAMPASKSNCYRYRASTDSAEDGCRSIVLAYGIRRCLRDPSGIGGLTAISACLPIGRAVFRDTHFGDTVKLGCTLRRRLSAADLFTPTFWTMRPRPPADPKQLRRGRVSQAPPSTRFVCRRASNVGGAYSNCGLSTWRSRG